MFSSWAFLDIYILSDAKGEKNKEGTGTQGTTFAETTKTSFDKETFEQA